MAIKYSRLVSDDYSLRITAINRWVRTRLPIEFLKQEIVLVSIVILSFILLIMSTVFNSDNEYESLLRHDSNFGVIVDCGSSGTRAHIFTWSKNISQDSLPLIDLVREPTGRALTKHITPGLSSLQGDPDKASDYMEPIMKFLSDSIPSSKHLDTPIYFMATAGLRLLEDATQKKILTDITRDLRAKFDFPRIKSRVIKGEYEGIYSWLSLNLDKIYKNPREAMQDKSIGMIEVGGASVQVAYELTPEVENFILRNLKTNDAITAFRSEQTTVNLSKNHYVKLFATTFLGLGVNSARESAIDLLIRDYLTGMGELGKQRSDDEIKKYEVRLMDPCLTEGSSEIVMRPIEVATNTKQPIGFITKERNRTFKVRLAGSGNFLNCINLLERLIQLFKSSRLNCVPSGQSCPMALLGEAFIPYRHHSFVGLSEMFFTTNEVMNSAGPFNKSHILHETNRICSTSYNTLIEQYSHSKSITHQDRILYECFKASWLLTLLHSSGFKLPSQYSNLTTLESLNGREIDWTIGAIMSEIMMINRDSR